MLRISRKACLLLTCANVLAFGAHAQAQPNAAPAAEAPADKAQVSEIVVTGSRITQNGYQATTPVTVAPVTELLQASPTSLADGLNKLPELIGSLGPNKQSNVFGTPTHGNVLNLRGIGPNRTLILLDGVRAPPTTYLNTVDVDLMPTLLVQRVDIVTAGASSVYGSDAVSGVVNYVLDSRFTGFKAVAQAGMADRGDAQNGRLGIAGGTRLLGGKGHFIGSFDFSDNEGYLDKNRPVVRDAGIGAGSTGVGPAGSASNPIVQYADARANFGSYGGFAGSGPFAGTNFSSPGVYGPLNKGTPTGSPTFFLPPSDYIYQGQFLSASAATRNATAFGRFTYDLTDDTSVYVQGLVAKSDIHYQGYPNLFFTNTQIPVFSGNPYIPAALQAQLTSAGAPSFNVTKLFLEAGPIKTHEWVWNYDFTMGLKGSLGRFKWSADYAHGDSEYYFAQDNDFNLARLAAATDAVVNPANGQTVCRPTLNSDPAIAALWQGCSPMNVLGYGAASQASLSYVEGVSRYHAVNQTNDLVGNISGDLFKLPAGPVAGSIGAEYRTASLRLTSNSDPSTAVNIAGLRGIAANTVAYYLTDQAQAHGSQDVKEVFAELAVPLLADMPLVKRADLNAAARWTDYSTSGSVYTWKVGGTWTPVEGLKLRATQSRDIRAPTLYDLYAGAQYAQGSVLDPHTGISTGFTQITSGNPKLVPEVGNTTTVGVVVQPRFLPGFSASVDYYHLNMTNAITTLTSLAVLQACEASGGAGQACANIVRPLPYSNAGPANFPTQITVSGVNASLIDTSGVDLDVTYRHRLGEGQLTGRVYATYLGRFATKLAQGQSTIDYAGYNAAGSGGVSGGLPRWKGNVSLTYEQGPFSAFVQENFISSLKFGPTLVYVNPKIASFLTTDATLTYRFKALGGKNVELFGTITNLFDAHAPPAYSTGLPTLGGTIVSLYDTTGRAFVLGARLSF